MKKFYSLLLWGYFSFGIAQQNPTLDVGLNSLTMNRGTIDVEVLTRIIVQKQKELKGEALKRFMYKLFPENNYTTKFYVQNCLNILLHETNPNTIEREIMELTTNYALAVGVAYAEVASYSYAKDTEYARLLDMVAKDDELNQFQGVDLKALKKVHKQLTKRKFKKLIQLDLEIKKSENQIRQKSNSSLENLLEKNSNDLTRKKNKLHKRLVRQKRRTDEFYLNKFFELNSYIALENDSQPLIYKNHEIYFLIKQIYNIKEENGKENEVKKESPKISNSFKDFFIEQNPNIKNTFNCINDAKPDNSKSQNDNQQFVDILESILVDLNYLQITSKDIEGYDYEVLKPKIPYITINQQECLKDIYNYNQQIKKYTTPNKILDQIAKQYKNHGNLFQKESIPFSDVLDIVSYTLSNNEQVKKLGFFKKPIDFTKDTYYHNLPNNYKNHLQNFSSQLSKKISDYINDYQVLKKFFLVKEDFTEQHKWDNLSNQMKDVLVKNLHNKINKGETPDFLKKSDKLMQLLYYKNIIHEISTINLEKTNLNFNNLNGENNVDINKLDELKNILYTIDKINSDIEDINKLINLKSSKYNYLFYDELRDLNSIKDNLIPELKNTFTLLDLKFEIKLNTIYNNSDEINYLDIPENSFISLIQEKIKDFESKFKEDKDKAIDQLSEWIKDYNLKNDNIKIVFNIHLKNTDNLNNQIKDLNSIKDTVASVYNSLKDIDFDKAMKDEIKQITKDTNTIKSNISNFRNNLLELKEFTTPQTADFNQKIEKLSELYMKLDEMILKDEITLEDIAYLEEYGIKNTLEIFLATNQNNKVKELIDLLNNITLEGNFRILNNIKIKQIIPSFIPILEFVSNLDRLNKAKTYTTIFEILENSNKAVIDGLGNTNFQREYEIISNAVTKYTTIDTSDNKIEIDVSSFLTDLNQHIERNNKSIFSLYLTLGLNENILLTPYPIEDSEEKINQVGFASEKLGIRLKIVDFRQSADLKNVVKNDNTINNRTPFINDLYFITYGSGLLYNIANTTTDKKFNFPHIGMGVGVRFFNALDFNITLGLPFVKNEPFGKYSFIGFGFDIPLGQYLEALGK